MNDLERIEKIFRMLGSTHDGEIINAVNSIRKILVAQDKNKFRKGEKLFKMVYTLESQTTLEGFEGQLADRAFLL